MSCRCYVASVLFESATSDLVQAETCALWTDNDGYYGPDGYIAAGDGHDDRLFGKRIVTKHFANGTYWESSDFGTLLHLDTGGSECPGEVNDTNFNPSFDYGAVTYPHGGHESIVYEDPVLGSEIRDYALDNSPYNDWEDVRSPWPIFDYSGHLDAVEAQTESLSFDTTTVNRLNHGGYTVSEAIVRRCKLRASLARAKLPVRIVYDLWNYTDDAAHAADQEFTLNAGNPTQDIVIPLVEEKEIALRNVRLFFCPWHL